MDRLWTPWRMEYIRSAAAADEEQGCIFCELPALGDDEKALILARGKESFVVLNKYPYNPGHVMVAPFRHVGDVVEVEEAEQSDSARLIRESIRALREAWEPAGFNVGMNVGRVAGAGIPDHVHWHVVPRWDGDTNFMPVVGQTKVLPELLEETYGNLLPHFGG